MSLKFRYCSDCYNDDNACENAEYAIKNDPSYLSSRLSYLCSHHLLVRISSILFSDWEIKDLTINRLEQ